jgi:hypothetical protein
MIKVIEVDQWTATGNIKELIFKDLNDVQDISGGDSEAVKKIFGGHFHKKEVTESDRPHIGYVWFTEGDDGKCALYKASYDSSG